MALVKRLVKGSPLTYAEADGNLTYLDNKVTGSIGQFSVFDSLNTVTGSNALSQTGNMITVDGNLTVTGNAVIQGDLTAMQYIISSSVTHFTESFSSGSTIFGDTTNDTHKFTGSVYVTSDINANGNLSIYNSLVSFDVSPSFKYISFQDIYDPFGNVVTLWLSGSTQNKSAPYIQLGNKGLNIGNKLSLVSTGVTITGSFTASGSSVFSGSAAGIVTPLSITSNTASLDLSKGNFYTLQLLAGTNTYINPTNIQPGQTSNILISTTGSATVSFPTTVLQSSGSIYIPTTTTGKDIITLVSYDSTTLYLANVKNFI